MLYKPFVDLIFHGLLWKKTKIVESFAMEFLTSSKRVHLREINKKKVSRNLINLIYKQQLCHLAHY